LRRPLFSKLLKHAPLSALIRLHLFRFVGIYFFIGYAYGLLPKEFALSGGIGDLVAAIGAIFAARAVERQKPYAYKLVIIWNIIGLLDIVNVLRSAIFATKVSLENGGQALTEIANFPFVWIPAFAPATIVALHVAVFIKLSSLGKKDGSDLSNA
jgi:hypothetical protein